MAGIEDVLNSTYGGGMFGGRTGGVTSGSGQNSSLIGSTISGSGSGSTPTFMQGLLGHTDANGIKTNGWGGAALGLGQGLMQGYQGMQQYGMAKKAFKEGQRQYNQDYAAQKGLTNANLEDRQRARVASNSGAYQSVSEYMEKHGVK